MFDVDVQTWVQVIKLLVLTHETNENCIYSSR
jgi:hypothetical protein